MRGERERAFAHTDLRGRDLEVVLLLLHHSLHLFRRSDATMQHVHWAGNLQGNLSIARDGSSGITGDATHNLVEGQQV